MKKLYYLIILTVILGLVLTGCSLLSNVGQVPTTEQSGITYLTKHTEGDPFTTVLIADGGDETTAIDVGEVLVWNDAGNLYVQYVVDDPWEMTGSHLYVGKTDPTDPVEFPSTPGQFPYSPGMEKSPSPNASYNDITMTYTIPLAEIWEYEFVGKGQGKGLNALKDAGGVEDGEEIFIAAHAKVQREYFEPVWQIGDVEETQMDNPCDEFNWPTIVISPQEFNIGFTLTDQYPWISRFDKGYATTINIHFNTEIEMLLGGRFLFSWSPGGSGNETIKILLDGLELDTVKRSGKVVTGWWDNKERFIDSFDVPAIEAGEHVLTINVTAGDGLVWDWLRLEEQKEETAWAEGDNQVFGKNWATYFTYTVPLHQIEVFAVSSTPVEIDLGVGNYKFVVSGTAFAGGAYTEDIEFDAKYSITHSYEGDTWTDEVSGYESHGPELLDLFINGDYVNWEACDEGHIYEYLWEGDGSPVTFYINDIYYPNNTGWLTVEIYKQ